MVDLYNRAPIVDVYSRLPDLRELIDPILGMPYSKMDCGHLCKYLIEHGLNIPVPDTLEDASLAVIEVWNTWMPDAQSAFIETIKPWDVAVFRIRGVISEHYGIVVDDERFVSTRESTGVCLEKWRTWKKRCLQVVRLRRLHG